MKIKDALSVDKKQFCAWCNTDIFLERLPSGKVFIVNESECEAAEDALQRGEVVLLRNGSRLTGTGIRFDSKSNTYIEFALGDSNAQ